MANEYKNPGNTPYISKFMLVMKRMKAELREHRYFLKQNIERRTEQLQKRIALLESGNATLCDKLAAAQKELAALKQQQEQALSVKYPAPNKSTSKLFVVSSHPLNPIHRIYKANVAGMHVPPDEIRMAN